MLHAKFFITPSFQINSLSNGLKAIKKSCLEKKCLFSANICLCLCPNPQWLLWKGPRKCSSSNILRVLYPSELWRPGNPASSASHVTHNSRKIAIGNVLLYLLTRRAMSLQNYLITNIKIIIIALANRILRSKCLKRFPTNNEKTWDYKLNWKLQLEPTKTSVRGHFGRLYLTFIRRKSKAHNKVKLKRTRI